MISITRYINIFEGGLAGHMAHPFDYTDFTGHDFIDLIDGLFSGKIEHMKEKLDGMNLNATMNSRGDVVFIRNNKDLNSDARGMSIDDMYEKWNGKEHQKSVFIPSAKIITQIFKKLDPSYFILDDDTIKVINCECIIAGKTNILPYAQDRVAFHGYKIYKRGVNSRGEESWQVSDDVEGDVDEIYRAAEGIDSARPRPDLVIHSAEEANKLSKRFKSEIEKLFKNENLSLDNTLDDLKKARFNRLAPTWMRGNDIIYNRLFNYDKSVSLTKLKKELPNNIEELKTMDDDAKKKIIPTVMEPIDNLFLSIGNELIDILDGFTNSLEKNKVVDQLKNDLEETIDTVNNSDSQKDKDDVAKQLLRFTMLDKKYNIAEGIVFMYKGRRMKLTGSFAPINAILGTRFNK